MGTANIAHAEIRRCPSLGPIASECVNLQEGIFLVTVFDEVPALGPTVNAELEHLTYLDVRFGAKVSIGVFFGLFPRLSIRVFDRFRFTSLTSLGIGGHKESAWNSPELFYEHVKLLRTLSYYDGFPAVLAELRRHTPSLISRHSKKI